MPSLENVPRFGRISLRLRLTIWVVIVVVLVQGALAAVAFLYQRQSARRALDGVLRQQTTILAEELSTPVEPERLRQRAALEADSELFQSFAMAVIDPASRILDHTEQPPPSALELAARSAEAQGPVLDWWEHDGELHRVIALPLGADHTLLAWTDAGGVSAQLAAIAMALVLASPLAAAGAAVAGWFIAGVAVGPIEEVRDIARRLTPESVGRRIKLGSAAAEVAQLQKHLNEALNRLDTGYRSQARFISNVSHELKTPISTLLAEAQVLARRSDIHEDARDFARSVEEEMRRLGRLVESFLLLTQVREGAPPRMQTALVNEIMAESVAHCTAVAEARDVRLRPTLLEDDDGLQLCVRGESELLRAMLDNLIRNAIRFSPPGGAVDICAARNGAGGGASAGQPNWVTISVRDHGPGISPALLDRIFDRFSQAPEERSIGRGTGLGLEIAKGVAELHGGDIAAENCRDAGARFTVRLPIAGAARTPVTAPD